MKKFSFLLLLVSSILTFSCNKEDPTPTPTCTTAVVKFANTSTNPYNLYIDDVFQKQIAGGGFQSYTLKEGVHKFFAEQASGFVLFATTKTQSVSIFGCQNTQWTLP